MANYHITIENDQNIILLDEAEIITSSGFMLDYVFQTYKCHCGGRSNPKNNNQTPWVGGIAPLSVSSLDPQDINEFSERLCSTEMPFNADKQVKEVLDYCFNLDLTVGFDLYVCDNSTIQQINSDYRQKNEPTDVISFALFADCKESRIIIDNQINLGQIVISAEKAVEQAKENNINLQAMQSEPNSECGVHNNLIDQLQPSARRYPELVSGSQDHAMHSRVLRHCKAHSSPTMSLLKQVQHDVTIPDRPDQLHNNKDFFEEFYFLLSHGILHLLGFDHKDENS
ncbi:MAG: rRNA maturation RNase YbeY, partial [Candidatus Gastranaerophilaceae bacterium]